MNELKINDIKNLVTIPDYSFYIYICLIIFISIICLITLYFIIKSFLNKKKSEEEIAFEILENITLNNSKEDAYKITKYGRIVAKDDRSKKLYYELIENLEKYKYKKNVQIFDNNVINQFHRFMDSVDV
ncbi:hypothetical protein CPU12_04950 [Malaciobacter molluscorum LMG 25693]|uniref:Uncharacterized protein n=1 Tax=Malaciobacter molluscorum LMG 25693 TaxID=870501 RepID=A0A2G1DJK6_9BACT|nr:hypothetical protein [Malaciobacter molluscorum]AXX91573.1 hypothetical protein AMOL_0571 [Malaciobacter molluscorum LMG 25693]PHO18630.1 hypothetical protein CPU12_04950 [Malaciobacter molluscorum LMG 25693]